MIISRKRFEEEVNKRVEEAVCKAQDSIWQEERQRDIYRNMADLEQRLIAVEKENGIDHPSHHNGNARIYYGGQHYVRERFCSPGQEDRCQVCQ